MFLNECQVLKLLTIVQTAQNICPKKKLYLVRAQDYKSTTFVSNNKFKVSPLIALSGCLRIEAILSLSPWKFFLQLLKPEAYLDPSRLR